MINVSKIKKDFPIFEFDKSLTYLDSTATSLKPNRVINKGREYYSQYSANIFRGVYKISEKATEKYEESRAAISRFIGGRPNEVVITRNTTEALNLVAYSMGRQIVSSGDEIATTIMEHHSNFVPWQTLALESGATFKIIDIDGEGNLNSDLNRVITRKTKILALTYVSNVLGTINPIKEIVAKAKKINPEIVTVVDAAQAAPHMKISVTDLGCDFLAFSSHKMLGPTGVGVLWGRYELLLEMFPFNYGGEMISEVHLDRTLFKAPPHKFEAGTPAIGEVIAFEAALDYLDGLGMENIREHEAALVRYATQKLKSSFGGEIEIMGPESYEARGGIISFTFGAYHAHDIAAILDEDNVAVRAGHHCAMPLHERLGVPSSVRASFYIYNDESDVNRLVESLKKVKKIL